MTRNDSTAPRTTYKSRLAPWFEARLDLSGPGDNERDEILGDLYHFDQFATDGELVLLRTRNGRALLRPHDGYPDAALTVIYLPHGSDRLVSFWMNRSSIADLTGLVAKQGQAVDFDQLLLDEKVKVPA